MRTESRSKARRPATAPNVLDKKPESAAGPKPETPLSTESSALGAVGGSAPLAGEISSRLPPIALTADGRIDTAKLRANTRDKLRTALADPALAPALGIAPIASTTTDAKELELFSTHVAPALYNALNSLLTSFPRRYGYSAEAAQVMAFDAGEIANLAPLTGRVLQKHVGGKSKYQEELMLATMILSGIMAKVTLLEKQATVLRMQRPAVPVASPEAGTSAEAPIPPAL